MITFARLIMSDETFKVRPFPPPRPQRFTAAPSLRPTFQNNIFDGMDDEDIMCLTCTAEVFLLFTAPYVSAQFFANPGGKGESIVVQ